MTFADCIDCDDLNASSPRISGEAARIVALHRCTIEALNAGGGGGDGGIGSSLVRYCDNTSGDTVAFANVVTNENGTTVEWFDAGFNSIGGQPANSDVCLADGGVGADLIRYCDIDTGALVGYAFTMTDGTATTIQWLDSVLAPIAGQPVNSEVCSINNPYITASYIQVCERFDLTQAVVSSADFTDAPTDINRIVLSDNSIASLIRSEIERALLVQNEEVRRGLPITNFVIETSNPVQSYEFLPSALLSGTSATIELDENQVVAWPANGTFNIAQLRYSIFENCNCRTVETLEIIDPDTRDVLLVDIVDPENYDPATGNKPSALDAQDLLPFGHLGPFMGPCPDPLQVVQLNELCCDSNLAENNADIANQRLAWLDGADASLMLDAIGGNPIAGNPGDDVFEVQDKLDPGVSPSFVVPASVGVDAGSNPPTYQPDSLNGLSTLVFDGVNNERLRLDTNNLPGASFTLFYLLRPTEATPGAFDSCLAVSAGSDGDNLNTTIGAYQLARQGNQTFTMQMRVDNADAVDPIVVFQTPVPNTLDRPSDGISGITNTRNLSMGFSDIDDFFNQEFHLITVTWDATTNILQGFLDGSLRFVYDLTPMAVTSGVIPSDYFRIFGNRGGNQYLDGQLAEMFFADTAFSNDEIATVNAYLICKWGIDPSLAAGGAGDLVLDEPGVFDTPTPFVRIVRADGEVRFRNKDNGLEYVLPPVPGLAICEVGEDCSGLTASGVVCYNADPGGTDETRMAFVFHDCAGIPVYRDTLTNSMLDTPVLIECEGLPVDVQIDKTWTLDLCDIQEDESELVTLYPGFDGIPQPHIFNSPSGNVTVNYLGGSDFPSGQNAPEQGLNMLGTGAQDVTQGLFTISGATSNIVLSIFSLSDQNIEVVQFNVAPIAWTNAEQINPLRFTGVAGGDLLTATFTFPAGTDVLVVRYSGDVGQTATLTQIEALQDIVTPFQRCFVTDDQGVTTPTNLDLDGNPYVIQGEDNICPDECNKPISQICYINPVFWEARDTINNYRIQVTVGNVNTTLNLGFPAIVNGFFTENQGLPGMNPSADEHPVAIQPGTANNIVVYSFADSLPADVPITLRLGHIDTETVTWSIVPDSQTVEAAGEITSYTWNDASVLNGNLTLTIVAPALWYVFGPFQSEVNNPILRAFGSVNCRGVVTYRNELGEIVPLGNEVDCGGVGDVEVICDRVGGSAVSIDLDITDGLTSYQVENSGIVASVSGNGLSGLHSADRGYVMSVNGSVAIFEVLNTDSTYQLVVYDLDVNQQIQFDRIPILFNGPVLDLGSGLFEGTTSEGTAQFTFRSEDGPLAVKTIEVNTDAFAYIGIETSNTDAFVPFRRDYSTQPPTNTDLQGNPYLTQGIIELCPCGCDDSNVAESSSIIRTLTYELNTGESWQSDVDLPFNIRLTEFSYCVINGAVDNSATDSLGNTITNLPTGFSQSPNGEHGGYLIPYNSINAGTGGRIIILATGEL